MLALPVRMIYGFCGETDQSESGFPNTDAAFAVELESPRGGGCVRVK